MTFSSQMTFKTATGDDEKKQGCKYGLAEKYELGTSFKLKLKEPF